MNPRKHRLSSSRPLHMAAVLGILCIAPLGCDDSGPGKDGHDSESEGGLVR